MKLKKAEKYLRKINQLFDSLKEEEELSRLELDLMREYTRKFYKRIDGIQLELEDRDPSSTEDSHEDIIEMEIDEYEYNIGSIEPKAKKKKDALAKKIAQEIEAEPEPEPEKELIPEKIELVSEPQRVVEPIKPVKPEPKTVVREEKKLDIPSFELELADTDTAPITAPSTEQQVATVEKPVAKVEIKKYEELFDFEESNDLSHKLSSAPISDIRSSMGLNERVLTINELFGGNAIAFDKTVKYLNAMNSFDEAKQYLSKTVIPEYGWNEESKRNKAKVLLKLIKRRYN